MAQRLERASDLVAKPDVERTLVGRAAGGADPPRQRPRRLADHVQADDVRAVLRASQGHGLTDARPGTDDRRDPAGQIE